MLGTQGEVREESLSCGSVAAQLNLPPTSAVSVWTQLDPTETTDWLTGFQHQWIPQLFSTDFKQTAPAGPSKNSLSKQQIFPCVKFKIGATTGTSDSTCCGSTFTSSSNNKAGETPEERPCWSEGKHCHLLSVSPQTTDSSFCKLSEIQSKAKLEQDALIEGQAIYKRRLTNGKKLLDVTAVLMRNWSSWFWFRSGVHRKESCGSPAKREAEIGAGTGVQDWIKFCCSARKEDKGTTIRNCNETTNDIKDINL